MGAGLFTVLEDRRRVVDFSRIFGREEVTILMRTPERASKADSLLAPFKKEVSELLSYWQNEKKYFSHLIQLNDFLHLQIKSI